MSVSIARLRKLERAVRLAAAVVLFTYVYAPRAKAWRRP